MIKAVILEDEMIFTDTLVKELKIIGGIEIEYISTLGKDIIQNLHKLSVEIAFIDIGLPDISGIEVAKIIRANFPDAEIIFITSFNDFTQEAIKCYATDYINKPIDKERLKKTIERIKRKLLSEELVKIKTGNTISMIRINDIFMIEAQGKKSTVYTDSKILTAEHSLKEFEKVINAHFFKTSRSFLVNINKIDQIIPYSKTSLEILFRGKDYKALLSKKNYPSFRTKIKTSLK